MFDSLHEECGVFGIFENQTTTVAQTAYLAAQRTGELRHCRE